MRQSLLFPYYKMRTVRPGQALEGHNRQWQQLLYGGEKRNTAEVSRFASHRALSTQSAVPNC
jgi:hypothetical protein